MGGHYNANPYIWNPGANMPHIARYFLARGWIMEGETVLDAGCGNGYGTELLSHYAGKIYGIDIDPECIEVANRDNKRDNTEYSAMDLGEGEWPDVEVTISIENMEHVANINHFASQAKKHTDRLIFVCVPFGGTTYAYEEGDMSPAAEKHDFLNEGMVDGLFIDDTWKKAASFHFGYSYVGIYFRRNP